MTWGGPRQLAEVPPEVHVLPFVGDVGANASAVSMGAIGHTSNVLAAEDGVPFLAPYAVAP